MKHVSHKRNARQPRDNSILIREMRNIIETINESEIRYKDKIQKGEIKETKEDLERFKESLQELLKKYKKI